MEWAKIEDGEYNEQVASFGPHEVTLYSDRDGERWSCYFDKDSGHAFDLDARDEHAARREAARMAEDWT